MMIDWEGFFLGTVLTLMLLGLACLILFGGCAIIQDVRAQQAEIACAARRMDSRHPYFSSKVTCVPPITRQDTTTVRINP